MVWGDLRVKRVWEGNRGHIEPEFDPEWSDLMKLRWEAAIVEMDTGIKIGIRPGGSFINGIPILDVYGLSVGATGLGPCSPSVARDIIHGIGLGATAAQLKHRRWAQEVLDNIPE